MKWLLTCIKNIAEGWKIFFGVIGMVTVISATAIKFDHMRTGRANNDVRIDKWIRYDSLEHASANSFRMEIRNQYRNLSDSLRTVNRSMRMFSTSQGKLRNYMINNAATKNDVLMIYNIFDVEKKSLRIITSEIQPEPSQSSTQ